MSPPITKQVEGGNFCAPVYMEVGVGNKILFAHAYGQTAAAASMAAEVIAISINKLSGEHIGRPDDENAAN